MASARYAPGLAALVQSLSERSGMARLEMTVLLDGHLPAGVEEAIAGCGAVDFVPLRELGHIEPKTHVRGVRRLTLQKLLMFRVPRQGRCVFIDADMVCLASLDLANLPLFATVVDYGARVERELDDGTPIFNSGLFTFEPDEVLFDELLEFYEHEMGWFRLGDQMVLNQFFHRRRPGSVTYLDPSWNVFASYADRHAVPLDEIRLLHFALKKPWVHPWVPATGASTRMVDLFELWWDFFGRSPAAPLLALTRPPSWALRLVHARPVQPVWGVVRRGRSLIRPAA